MSARPARHLHLIHSQDEPEPADLEAEGWNWVLLVAVVLALVFWTAVVAGVVLLLA